MSKRFFFLFVFLNVFVVSCAPIQLIEDGEAHSLSSIVFPMEDREVHTLPSISSTEELEGLVLDLNSFNTPSDSGNNSEFVLQTKPFPMVHNSRVNYWINYYSRGTGQQTMRTNLEKLGRYGNYMGTLFRQEGLPQELVYVAMVESGFKYNVESSANALGYWQFIPSTARVFDLKINSQVDERRDFWLPELQ